MCIRDSLCPHVAAGQRELHAREELSIGRNVARGMARAARRFVHDAFVRRWWRRAELVHVAHQVRVAEHLPQIIPLNSQRDDRTVPVHLGCDGRAVSYTHLDVYKRQSSDSETDVLTTPPVSYCHDNVGTAPPIVPQVGE